MEKTLCIYHGDCADGFTSAWVVRKYVQERLNEDYPTEFFAGSYSNAQNLPNVEGIGVLLVDFSYKRAVMEEIIKKAEVVTILDHHKTAQADLHELPGLNQLFDMNRSGARITWDYFFPGQTPPKLLLAVEDRDLWRFALRSTREAVATLFSHPYTFEAWDYLMNEDFDKLAKEGEALERNHFKEIRQLLPKMIRKMKIGGFVVPVANLPETMTSDAANIMSEGEPFAACYTDYPHGRIFSLRSAPDGIDVSQIALLFGGGGHKHAAGFSVTFDQAREFEL